MDGAGPAGEGWNGGPGYTCDDLALDLEGVL